MSKAKNELDLLLDGFDDTVEGECTSLDLDLASLVFKKLHEWGWSQKQLADKAGMKESYVSRVLTGRANWTRETAVRLLHPLGIRARIVNSNNRVHGAAPDDGVAGKILIKTEGSTNDKATAFRSRGATETDNHRHEQVEAAG